MAMWSSGKRASIIVVACTAVAVAAGQAPSELPRFRVAVDIVSIDAVVTDRKGEVVRGLTAADFEVFQDGKRQKVTFAQFVPVMTVAAPAARAAASITVPEPAAMVAPPVPAPPLQHPVTQGRVAVRRRGAVARTDSERDSARLVP